MRTAHKFHVFTTKSYRPRWKCCLFLAWIVCSHANQYSTYAYMCTYGVQECITVICIISLQGDSQGDLLVALTYSPKLGSLKGVVLKATNLKKQDIVGLAG